MAKAIEIIVGPDGSLKIDAVGFKGADCEKATAYLEKALGKQKGKEKKPEFYRQVQNHQRVGG
ncbi:MAG: DUF2997 domain-containing protein [bacterium]